MPNVHVTPIVGLPQFSGWSHVIEGTHSSPHRFVAVLAVSGKQASNIGRDVAGLLLSETINSAEELYGKLAAAINIAAQAECLLAVSAALVSEKKTVFAVSHAAVFLRRHTKIGTILQSAETLKLIEGSRTEEDVFVLATEQASQFLGEIELKSKQGYDVDTIITSIVPGVHAQTDSSLSAFAFVTNSDAEQEYNHVQQEADAELNETAAEQSEVVVEAAEPEIASEVEHSARTNNSLAITNILTHLWRFVKLLAQALLAVAQWLLLLLSWLGRSTAALANAARGKSTPLTDGSIPVIYHSPVRQRRTKLQLMAAALLIAAALIGVGYALQVRSRELSQAESLVTPLRTQVSDARALVDTQPVEARDQVQRVIQELQALQATHADQKRMVAIFAAEQAVAQQVFDSISGQEALTALPVFYDLRLVKSDFVTTHTTVAGQTAVFLDAEKQQLIALNLSEKSPQLFSLGDLGTIRAVTGGGEASVYMLNGGISSLQLRVDQKPETVKAEGESTRGGTQLGTFDRFVYVFNPAKRNLYRYARQDSGYSDPIGWLQVSKGLDYATVVSMTIDGDIWLGSADGSIRKFTSGQEQAFAINGLPQALDSAVQLYTSADTEKLYVLEPARHRVVVLSKSGEFLRELSNQSLGAATGLLVLESMNKAFVVSGATVFELAL